MLFLTYWKLNEDVSIQDRFEVASTLMESGAFPPENVEILRWDATPDGWGILVSEADSAADVSRAVNLWRASAPGFFEETRTAPATPIEATMEQTADLIATVSNGD